jgi:putative ABC transport system permease protein
MSNIGPVYVEGYTPPDESKIMLTSHNVSLDYFKTLQIPIQQGRTISEKEHQSKDRVVLINESLARRFWPNKNPLGRELTFTGKRYRIIGIVPDVVQGNVKGDKPNQGFFPFDATFHGPELSFVVRADYDPGQVVGQARAILTNMDAGLALYDVSTFKAQLNQSISRERFTTAFLTLFASIALVLVVIGLYGVISYAVTQRTREIGIRMALGAQKGHVLAIVLKQGAILLLFGLIIGVLGSLGLTRFLAGILYGVSATDPATFIAISLLITIVSLLACCIPARRAAKVDPMEALRYE